MKPTKKWVEARLRAWIDRLGLGHWRVSINWDEPAESSHYASVWRANDYDDATVYLCEGWREMDRADLDRVICHEMLHLSVRDMSRAHDFVLHAIDDENVPANNIAIASWKRAEEGDVDRLAHALVAAFGDS